MNGLGAVDSVGVGSVVCKAAAKHTTVAMVVDGVGGQHHRAIPWHPVGKAWRHGACR